MNKNMTSKHLDAINSSLQAVFVDIALTKGFKKSDVTKYVAYAQDWDCWYFTHVYCCKLKLLKLFIKEYRFEDVKTKIDNNRKRTTRIWR